MASVILTLGFCVFFGFSGVSWAGEKTVLVVERHERKAMEQAALVVEPDGSLRLTLNSNFLDPQLPAILGVETKKVGGPIAAEAKTLEQEARSSKGVVTPRRSPHRLRVFANGSEVSAGAKIHGKIVDLLRRAIRSEGWTLEKGKRFSKTDSSMKCESDAGSELFCETELGFLHVPFEPVRK